MRNFTYLFSLVSVCNSYLFRFQLMSACLFSEDLPVKCRLRGLSLTLLLEASTYVYFMFLLLYKSNIKNSNWTWKISYMVPLYSTLYRSYKQLTISVRSGSDCRHTWKSITVHPQWDMSKWKICIKTGMDYLFVLNIHICNTIQFWASVILL